MITKRQIDIVIVEDDPDDWELTVQAARQANNKVNVIHFRDGPDVLDFIHETQSESNLALIILNIGLIRSDGLEVLKHIRENEITRFTPVVIFSGSEEEHKIKQAYELGANSFVIKPTAFEEYEKFVSSLTFFWSVVNTVPDDWNHHYHHDQNSTRK